ncbi:YkvA family protein [Azospirillum isscasi]|uniref:YkvA family protein n=1 Tax=Azospirillum isscasi TaxID=3053926 RepID=A0ABU0WHF5_9PROT|nr:YkvA family protein [Azospirillum isscasi]MDQ2103653.1 YkvA family protein [Azospirillum isscasi]
MQTATDGTTEAAGAVPAVIDPIRVEQNERLVRRRFWNTLRANLHRIPFLEQALAAFFCATDPLTPVKAKAVLMAALAYFVLPADSIPDWLIAVGFVDDAAVLAAAVQAVRSNLRPEHQDRARSALNKVRMQATGDG